MAPRAAGNAACGLAVTLWTTSKTGRAPWAACSTAETLWTAYNTAGASLKR